MSKRLFKYFITIVLFSLISFIHLPLPSAFAVADICSSDASDEIKDSAGCNDTADELPETIINILTAIIGVCGIVAVVFIIIGGVNYMTSEGDSAKTKKGKDTILYASIGLIICALAFIIVNWVIRYILSQG